jgi:hypothetical protein
LLGRGVAQFENNSVALNSESVVFEAFACFNVVLIFRCPVEDDLFPTVGDGVSFVSSVASFGNKVAVLVITGEESVEVVVDAGFESSLT